MLAVGVTIPRGHVMNAVDRLLRTERSRPLPGKMETGVVELRAAPEPEAPSPILRLVMSCNSAGSEIGEMSMPVNTHRPASQTA